MCVPRWCDTQFMLLIHDVLCSRFTVFWLSYFEGAGEALSSRVSRPRGLSCQLTLLSHVVVDKTHWIIWFQIRLLLRGWEEVSAFVYWQPGLCAGNAVCLGWGIPSCGANEVRDRLINRTIYFQVSTILSSLCGIALKKMYLPIPSFQPQKVF